jgi:hypothetical protein
LVNFGHLVVVGKAEADMLDRRGLLRALGTSLLAAPAAAAARLPMPKGEVILTVRGRIAATNDGASARLDRDLLLAWGRDELRTTTPFTDGVGTFGGVLASRLLDALGAGGSQLQARALNDYAVTIPIAELRAYPILLALDHDGRPLSVRERGPLWMIYPWSQHPELDDRVRRQRSIWQLTEIEVT